MDDIENNDIESRVKRLEAIEAIKTLKAKYFHACDQKQLADIKGCFVDGEVLIDYGAVGRFKHRDELLALFKDKACHEHIIDMHHGQNPQITVVSEHSATAVWDLYFYQIDNQANTLMQLGGFYQDQYCCVDGQWLLVETVFTATSTLVSSIDDGMVKVLIAAQSAG